MSAPLVGAPLLGAAVLAAAERKAVVQRHDPKAQALDPMAPLSVGNGEFAFTADVTGLQSFPDAYLAGIPLCTQSQWGWHSVPLPAGLDPASFRMTEYETHGRMVGYPTSGAGQKLLFDWLRENPHRLNLGRIGLRLTKRDGTRAAATDLQAVDQRLDLWSGTLHSRFELEGKAVRVQTACHPALDGIAVSVESELVKAGALVVEIEFPYGSPDVPASDWKSAGKHKSVMKDGVILRELDGDRYEVAVAPARGVRCRQEAAHRFVLEAAGGAAVIEASFGFFRFGRAAKMPAATEVFRRSAAHWERFWTSGGAVDLSASSDARWKELERRIVLSQYLTAIQCAGSLPPQETGLTCNSWYGKFHLEMHWWHAVHFAYWDRLPLLERSLHYYRDILPGAKAWAVRQGYTGARWPKMTAKDGRDSPSSVGPLLIWQQPHPIYYAELCRKFGDAPGSLRRYKDVVLESAEFMASFAYLDPKRGEYVLGPPVIPAQENHPPNETWNPTYELEYWRWGLETAQRWRTALGMPREGKWDDVIARLAKPSARDGVYLAHENCPQTYTERNRDHPSMLGALGLLPGASVDRETMRRTLRKVMKDWRWADTWGWDYPMAAMTAARLGEGEMAVDLLLLDTPKNRYLPNGHNYQRKGLHLYLPGNGGLLTAIACMAAGWEGGPAEAAPGFPRSGWKVQAAGLRKVI
ncbi:MAG: glycoside hydrolase family 65 [Acidobacteria bacterium]|nr:glycoside hydrolase family 65 [Acidobacteriota bacterium]